jgi:capsular polysaccharide biosynthesis protein
MLQVLRPAPYESQAKMLIRYAVTDGQLRSQGAVQQIAIVHDPIRRTIMDEQLEILTSLDLAQQVAEKVGPNKLLKKVGGGEDLARATALVKNGLRVAVPTNSSVIQIAFRHPDSAVVQEVLREVLAAFLRSHVEVYRSAGDVSIAGGKVTNISSIQSPSPPAFDFADLFRLQATVLIAGVMAGIGWVLLVRLIRVGVKLPS